jgi:hypothetical protein
MSAQSDPVDDAHASAQQWVAWLQELTADRPAVRDAIDRCLRALVLDARRRQMLARLDGLTEQDLDTVGALITQLHRHPPPDEPT